MIKLVGIYTIRDIPQPSFWDIVFEWEDEMSKALGVPLIFVGERYQKIYQPNFIRKIFNRLDYFRLKDKFFSRGSRYYLAFHIGPPGVYSFYSAKNVVPIVIDFWKFENLKKFKNIFSLNRFVFITSREVYNYLNAHNIDLFNIQHLALSLPDKYINIDLQAKRSIDVIQFGRQNRRMDEYMGEYLKEFPDVHYVHALNLEGKITMHSNKLGILSTSKNRAAFIEMLTQSRVSLLSSPGMDEGESRTGGFSPVTPRFLESAACGCKMIGRYPDNDDFEYWNISEVCPNVDSYEDFKRILKDYLSTQEIPNYKDFLKKQTTSVRASELKHKLNLA